MVQAQSQQPNGNRKCRVIVREAAYDSLEDTVSEILTLFPREWAGKNVLVKPNILGPFPPEKAITTNPALVRAVVRQLKRRGAIVIVGDNPGHIGYGLNRSAAEITGIAEASEGCYANIGTESLKAMVKNMEVQVSRAVMDCDILVSLPKLKTHIFTVMTGAVKNSYGILVGREKSKLHQHFWNPAEFAGTVAQVYAIRPPDLVIMDAIVGMEGDGPNSPYLRDIRRLMASDNGVALDTIACKIMGIPPENVSVLTSAHSLGLGPISESEIDIIGSLPHLENFRLPVTYSPIQRARQVVVDRMLGRGKIRINYDKCTKCLMCMQACPAHAISAGKDINGGKPVVDHSKCIHCFCCKEMCQYDAIRLAGTFTFLQNIYNKATLLFSARGKTSNPGDGN